MTFEDETRRLIEIQNGHIAAIKRRTNEIRLAIELRRRLNELDDDDE